VSAFLKGRLGLDGAEMPHKERASFLALRFGRLEVSDGCLTFVQEEQKLVIPYQRLSVILLEPGSSITHDALRLCARHGVGVAAVGVDAAKCYSAPPLLAQSSELARRQAQLWATASGRLEVALRQYTRRFGEKPKVRELDQLRGLEGARIREFYVHCSREHGFDWTTRRNPEPGHGIENEALNYAAHAVYAAAAVAVYTTGTIPQLGFLHEDAGNAFVLDTADLYRTELTIPAAFAVLRQYKDGKLGESLERAMRQELGRRLRQRNIVSTMIDDIKALLA
jgi:CRISPR-associated protein Cas1